MDALDRSTAFDPRTIGRAARGVALSLVLAALFGSLLGALLTPAVDPAGAEAWAGAPSAALVEGAVSSRDGASAPFSLPADHLAATGRPPDAQPRPRAMYP